MFRLFRIRFFSGNHLWLECLGGTNMLFGGICALLSVPAAVFSGSYITWMLKFIFALFEAVIGFHLANGSYNMECFSSGYWKKEFHRAVMHDDWAKIYAYASEFSKIFEKYAYFYICTDTFHDLPLQQLERALNILAEKNPEYFTGQLIETVLSDAENGSENTYRVCFKSEETLEIKNLTDNQNQKGEESIDAQIDTTDFVTTEFSLGVFLCCCIGVFMPLIMIAFWKIAI